ncbi:FkbM family methyltransferase [Azohydromonas sediminis]|uniref:FkbM family methyltransferase n=1 Tax=Azohydromonas sediminis TaxID=2259674 RepID=UPI000E65DBA9|nr:FkbM family methyltransferase [Azohydromonas sediminis]
MSLYEKFQTKLKREGIAPALQAALRWMARRVRIPYDVQPYEYVQRLTERSVHRFLRSRREDIRLIIIVGAHLGHEVKSMRRRFPKAEFKLFEASPRYVEALRGRFGSDGKVQIFDCAVSDTNCELTFYETNLAGSGSLLKVGELAAQSYGMKQTETYKVQARRLDDHAAENQYADGPIDCLWIDVQGAEMGVLRSTGELLTKVRSVFVEVSAYKPLYDGGATLADITGFLGPRGFVLVGLGTDPSNGTGNALFVRPAGSAVASGAQEA